MESLAADMSSECLVTDLVNELSSGLEIPFLMRDEISLIDKQDNTLYDNSFQRQSFIDDSSFETPDSEIKYHIKNEIDCDISGYWSNSDIQCQSINEISGISSGSQSCSGSGSECSATEILMIKNDLDTPPITPPDERISPESAFLLSSEELKFIPITPDDHQVKSFSFTKKKSNAVRIQPKPYSDSLNIFDFQDSKSTKVICNVFGDMNLNLMKNKVDSNVFLSSNKERKKSVLSRKDLELQAKRKQERMIRNRESAYLSRKRKKEHVAYLEKQVTDLITENSNLRLENYSLRQRLANYEEVDIPATKSSKNVLRNSSKKATALFALLFTLCLNFGSFSSLVNEIKWNKSEVSRGSLNTVDSSEVRHARSLLWAETEFKDTNSTFPNVTTTSCPAYINQSESIRLESELRKWIEGEDDYSGSYTSNISKLSQYFYSWDKPQVKEKSIKTKKMKKKMKSTSRNNLEMDMYKMKANLFNIDTFFETVHRRDDTFYLVSFSGDHLLLPALSHSKTSRPKMSLMLPAFLSNVTGATSDQVEMMQIDCEVTNTQVLSVNENDIPSHMRPFSNFTAKTNDKIVKKSEKYVNFFMNNEENLLSLKENQLNLKETSKGVKNYTSVRAIKKPMLKLALAKLRKYQSPGHNFEGNGNSENNSKTNISKSYFEFNIFDNVLLNQTNKENSSHESINRKNLLRMLMVNSHVFGSKAPMVTDQSTGHEKNQTDY